MVGDDKYPITDVVATNEGFIALNQPKLYLYRKGMKRKRVGLKTTYGNWINVPGSKISFDTVTTRLYAHLKRINQETGYGEEYIGRTSSIGLRSGKSLLPVSGFAAQSLFLSSEIISHPLFIS